MAKTCIKIKFLSYRKNVYKEREEWNYKNMHFNAFQVHSELNKTRIALFKSSDESIYQHPPCCSRDFSSKRDTAKNHKLCTQTHTNNFFVLTLTPFWLLKSVLRHWMAIFICGGKKKRENYSVEQWNTVDYWHGGTWNK